jgi:hypothetical protein
VSLRRDPWLIVDRDASDPLDAWRVPHAQRGIPARMLDPTPP